MMARHTRRKPTPRPRQPRPRHPRPPNVPATHRVASTAALDRTRSLPASSGGITHPAGASAARELIVPAERSGGDAAGLAPVLIELAGAQHGDLRAALGVWQREQDRLMNRAWRRPGGMARPAGL